MESILPLDSAKSKLNLKSLPVQIRRTGVTTKRALIIRWRNGKSLNYVIMTNMGGTPHHTQRILWAPSDFRRNI